MVGQRLELELQDSFAFRIDILSHLNPGGLFDCPRPLR